MPPVVSTILDEQILPATPTSTLWFLNSKFLVFQSDLTGEYVTTGEFIEVAVVLYAEISPGVERVVKGWQDTIDTIHLIELPKEIPNDCFPMRLLINPSTGFHARIFAISC